MGVDSNKCISEQICRFFLMLLAYLKGCNQLDYYEMNSEIKEIYKLYTYMMSMKYVYDEVNIRIL